MKLNCHLPKSMSLLLLYLSDLSVDYAGHSLLSKPLTVLFCLLADWHGLLTVLAWCCCRLAAAALSV